MAISAARVGFRLSVKVLTAGHTARWRVGTLDVATLQVTTEDEPVEAVPMIKVLAISHHRRSQSDDDRPLVPDVPVDKHLSPTEDPGLALGWLVLLGVIGNEGLRQQLEIMAGWRDGDGRWLVPSGVVVTGTGAPTVTGTEVALAR